jgi:hypothetical protein
LRSSKRNKMVFLIIAVLVVALIGAFCARKSISSVFKAEDARYDADDYGYTGYDSILLRTDRMIYDEDEIVIGMLINLSPHAIEVRRGGPLIYELTASSWLPPIGAVMPRRGYSLTYEKGWVQPGSVLPINTSFYGEKVLTKPPNWKMLELQYFYDGNEYVVYSNEILIAESSQPSRFRMPPSDLPNTGGINTEIVAPYVVALTNNSKVILWFNPLCSDIEVDVNRPERYPLYATLQRQSSEGTWQVLRPDKERCTIVKEAIRIEPGETVELFVGDGQAPPDELDPGVYRWHLVNYIDPFPECYAYNACFLSGVHLFTDTFEP